MKVTWPVWAADVDALDRNILRVVPAGILHFERSGLGFRLGCGLGNRD